MSGTTITRIRRALLSEFEKEADPTRALQQQAYMKSVMPYLGVTMPVLRSAAKKCFHRSSVALPRYRKWLTPDSLAMLEEFIVTGARWDFVDGIATRFFGHLLANYR